MLWYKAWLETRGRFLTALIGITLLCAYRTYDLTQVATPSVNYYYFAIHSVQQVLNLMWLVAAMLLMMGGIVQEKGNGSATFTLGLPVSRSRLMTVRISTGIVQLALLVAVPWAAVYATAYLSVAVHPVRQVMVNAATLASGGAVFAGAALLISSLMEGTYTAPLISAGIVLLCANAPRSLAFVNPLAFINGGEYVASAPMPWGHAVAYLGLAAALIVASVKAIDRKDF